MYTDEKKASTPFQRRQHHFLSLITSGKRKEPVSDDTHKNNQPSFRWKTIAACLVALGALATLIYLDSFKMVPAYVVPTLIEPGDAVARWEVKTNAKSVSSPAPPVFSDAPAIDNEKNRDEKSAPLAGAVPPLVLLKEDAIKSHPSKHEDAWPIQTVRRELTHKKNTRLTTTKRGARHAASDRFKKKVHAGRVEAKRREVHPKRATSISAKRKPAADADVSLLEALIRWRRAPIN